MTVDPDSISDRSEVIDPSELDRNDGKNSLSETADIDPELEEKFNL